MRYWYGMHTVFKLWEKLTMTEFITKKNTFLNYDDGRPENPYILVHGTHDTLLLMHFTKFA